MNEAIRKAAIKYKAVNPEQIVHILGIHSFRIEDIDGIVKEMKEDPTFASCFWTEIPASCLWTEKCIK
jgi:hypothetical protein